MRKLLTLALCTALLAGCAAAPAQSTSAAAVQPTAVPTAAQTDTQAAQTGVLDQFVDFGADTAGGSLKTDRAAAALVEYLSVSDIGTDTAATWLAGLTEEEQANLDLNWPGILAQAQAICSDPAAQADELASAGVTTDFTAMPLTDVPDKLVTINTVLTGKAG